MNQTKFSYKEHTNYNSYVLIGMYIHTYIRTYYCLYSYMYICMYEATYVHL